MKKLYKDIGLALLCALAVFTILSLANRETLILKNLSPFHSTVTTLLGLLFTLLAIIYTFESQFEESRAMKVLKEHGQYIDIVEIFFYTVAFIGLVWLYTFFLTVFPIYTGLPSIFQKLLSLIAIWGFFGVIIRLWRCFYIFIRLNQAVRE